MGRWRPFPVGDRNGRGRKERDSRTKRGRNVRFGDNIAAAIGAYRGGAAAADRPEPTVST